MATGYTCGQDGCHVNSVFAVNSWGYSEDRVDAVNGSTVAMTGHGTGMNYADEGTYSDACGPCHSGAAAGGYRFDGSIPNSRPSRTDGRSATYAKAYGCDQCHDMIGVATNTTAWPHGNRGIDVYEWNTNGSIKTTAMTRGNLWMYRYQVGTNSASPDSFNASDRDNSFTVVTNAVGGASVGNIDDGVCLKCHVAVDDASWQLEQAKFPANTSPNMNISGEQHELSLSTSVKGEWIDTWNGSTPVPAPTITDPTDPDEYRGPKVIYLFR